MRLPRLVVTGSTGAATFGDRITGDLLGLGTLATGDLLMLRFDTRTGAASTAATFLLSVRPRGVTGVGGGLVATFLHFFPFVGDSDALLLTGVASADFGSGAGVTDLDLTGVDSSTLALTG